MARKRPPANAWVSEDFINAGEAARRLAFNREDRDPNDAYRPVQQPALVSTAASYTIGDPPTGGIIRPKANEGWEKEVWAFYDAIGELHYVATQYGRAVSRARLYVAKYNEDGSPEEVKDGKPGEINRQMLGGEARSGDVLFTSSVQQFISGQSLIIADDETGWDAFSEQDFTVNQGAARKGADRAVYKVDRGSGRRDFLPEGTLTIHMWDRHPGRSSAVDSSVRPALPYLRELARLDQYVQSILLSRIALSGILQLPPGTEVVVPPELGPMPKDANGLMHVLATIGTMNISNPGTAAAVLPVLLQMGAPDQKLEHLTLDQPLTAEVNALREMNLKRLAMSMDMAPEAMSGFSNVKYSNAEWIQTESVLTHIMRRVGSFVSALTTHYVVPALGNEFFVAADLSDLLSDEDKSDTAIALYDRGEIDGNSLRKKTNMRDTQAPEGEELLRQLAIRAVTTNPSLFPVLAPLLGLREVVTLTPAQQQALEEGGGGDSGLEPQDIPDAAPTALPDGDASDPKPVREPQRIVSDGLVAACDVVVSAALCAAGSKWRKRVRSRVAQCRNTDPQAVYLVHALTADREPHQTPREYAAALIADRWPQVPRIAALHEADATCLQATLTSYVVELIEHQRPHHPSTLAEVVLECVA